MFDPLRNSLWRRRSDSNRCMEVLQSPTERARSVATGEEVRDLKAFSLARGYASTLPADRTSTEVAQYRG
ncbi:MAG: hypothetical protein ACREQR_20520, partial [Candidatus Binataceae bacterium]